MKTVFMMVILTLGLSATAQFHDHTGFRQQNRYQQDFGPKYTARWENMGTNRVQKFINEEIVIRTYGQMVNEIVLGAVENSVQINSATAYLTNGEVIELRQATGYIHENRRFRVQLDYSYSRSVQKIVLNATSPNLVGSRGQVSILVGYAY